MNEKAVGYILIFSMYLVLARFSTGWLWLSVYATTNTSPADVSRYRRKVRHNPKKLYAWLLENSIDEAKTKRTLIVYWICKIPAAAGILISCIGLFTHAVDRVMDIGAFVLLGYNMLILLVGALQSNSRFYP